MSNVGEEVSWVWQANEWHDAMILARYFDNDAHIIGGDRSNEFDAPSHDTPWNAPVVFHSLISYRGQMARIMVAEQMPETIITTMPGRRFWDLFDLSYASDIVHRESVIIAAKTIEYQGRMKFTAVITSSDGSGFILTPVYEPSNSDAGIAFEDRWCAACKRDKASRESDGFKAGCSILARAMAFSSNDPEYPREWIVRYSDLGGESHHTPTCTAFKPIPPPQPRKHTRKRINPALAIADLFDQETTQ